MRKEYLNAETCNIGPTSLTEDEELISLIGLYETLVCHVSIYGSYKL